MLRWPTASENLATGSVGFRDDAGRLVWGGNSCPAFEVYLRISKGAKGVGLATKAPWIPNPERRRNTLMGQGFEKYYG